MDLRGDVVLHIQMNKSCSGLVWLEEEVCFFIYIVEGVKYAFIILLSMAFSTLKFNYCL